MSAAAQQHTVVHDYFPSQSSSPEVLADIYQPDCNIAIWQRQLPDDFLNALSWDIQQHPIHNVSLQISASTIEQDIAGIASDRPYGAELRKYLAQTIDMFCVLFDTPKAGLRLSTLNSAMCPRFHVDKVPCRLVTSFCGPGTQWLAHDSVDRSKLGHGSEGKPDHASGLFTHTNQIQHLACGDVALLKGETWEGNEGAGLVHRSPMLNSGEVRLLLTLDLVY
ncbi:MAG: DUF1826 domain-containing protein [Glaciecola sp.]